jgi:restriction system protein
MRDLGHPLSPDAPLPELSASFIDRERELGALSSNFRSGKRIGSITGPAGVGKTTLCYVFLSSRRHPFSNRIVRAYPPAMELAKLLPRSIRRPTLLVIDEAHLLAPETVHALESLLSQSPMLSILLVGQVVPSISFADQFTVLLTEFPREAAIRFLQDRISGVALTTASTLADLLGGNPMALASAAFAVLNRGIELGDLLSGIRNFSRPGLLGPDGKPLSANSKQFSGIVLDVSSVNDHLYKELRDDPTRWYALPTRKFEEIVAQLLEHQGYRVALTPSSRDGGFDLYAARKDNFGEFLYLVECKRYTPPKKVGVAIVRSLRGVLSEHRASGAAIVTTSYFTSGAKMFQREFQHQLKLHDYLVLQKWLVQRQST